VWCWDFGNLFERDAFDVKRLITREGVFNWWNGCRIRELSYSVFSERLALLFYTGTSRVPATWRAYTGCRSQRSRQANHDTQDQVKKNLLDASSYKSEWIQL